MNGEQRHPTHAPPDKNRRLCGARELTATPSSPQTLKDCRIRSTTVPPSNSPSSTGGATTRERARECVRFLISTRRWMTSGANSQSTSAFTSDTAPQAATEGNNGRVGHHKGDGATCQWKTTVKQPRAASGSAQQPEQRQPEQLQTTPNLGGASGKRRCRRRGL